MKFSPRCPSCRTPVRWENNPHRPFCSERCRLADLGGWMTEQYRIPGSPSDPGPPDADDEHEPS